MKKNAATVFGKIFAKVFLGILIVFLVGICAYQAVVHVMDDRISDNIRKEDESGNQDSNGEKAEKREKLITILYTRNGSDQFGDAILREFDVESGELNYIVIPAELSITVDSITHQQLQVDSDTIPQTLQLKDIPQYFTDGTAQCKAANRILKAAFGLNYIEYYEEASQDGLVSIINLIDPVEFRVPSKMVFKNPDGINEVLRKGEQKLIGTQAVGLMQYTKGYEDPVGQRASLAAKYWRSYYKAVADQNKKDLTNYYKEYYECVDGTASYEGIEPYINDIAKSDGEFVTVRLLPGGSAGEVFQMDQQKVSRIMEKFQMEGTGNEEDAEVVSDENGEPVSGDAPDYTIEVVNAAQVAGTAGKWQEALVADGYQVIGVSTASEQQGDTVIYVSEDGIGEELLQYFPNARIEYGETGEAQVRIMVGLDYAQ